MEENVVAQKARRWLIRRAGRWVVAAFWLIQFAALTSSNYIEDPQNAHETIVPRAIVLVVGMLISFGIIEAAVRALSHSFRARIAMVSSASILGCALLLAFNFFVFMGLQSSPGAFKLNEFMYVVLVWSWFFVSEGGAILALSYSFDLQDRERRLSEMQRVAERARLTALRFQLNPHFLFNTLNSVVALASRDGNSLVESMVNNLSDFLRSTLELDPLAQIPLEEEMKLQFLYLSIEEVRFASRLQVEHSVPEDLKRALVPALITQPLIENAVKYGLSTSIGATTIRLEAKRKRDELILTIENEVGAGGAARKGTGLGLANVRDRLKSVYDGSHRLRSVLGNGMYMVEVRIPLHFDPISPQAEPDERIG